MTTTAALTADTATWTPGRHAEVSDTGWFQPVGDIDEETYAAVGTVQCLPGRTLIGGLPVSDDLRQWRGQQVRVLAQIVAGTIGFTAEILDITAA